MTATLVFTCSICGEPSQSICAYCTKDACANHLCERCGRCSDCCECEVKLVEESLEHVPEPVIASAEAEQVPVEAGATDVAPTGAAALPGEETRQPAETQETGDLAALFAPEPVETTAPLPPAEPAAEVQPDLSKLFAPEPDTPSPVVPPSAGPSFEPDLSKLFAPEPDSSAAPVVPTGPTGDPDLSKLFAPEPEPKPAPPVFRSAGRETDTPEAKAGEEDKPEPDEASGDPT